MWDTLGMLVGTQRRDLELAADKIACVEAEMQPWGVGEVETKQILKTQIVMKIRKEQIKAKQRATLWHYVCFVATMRLVWKKKFLGLERDKSDERLCGEAAAKVMSSKWVNWKFTLVNYANDQEYCRVATSPLLLWNCGGLVI